MWARALAGVFMSRKGEEGTTSEFLHDYRVVGILLNFELREWFPNCPVPDHRVMSAEEYCLSLKASLGHALEHFSRLAGLQSKVILRDTLLIDSQN